MERALGFAVCAMAWTTLCLAFFAALAAIRLGMETEAKDRRIEGLHQKCRALTGILRDRDGRAA
jgi:hypothetical protein